MPDYKIITDSACDLPGAMLEALDVASVPLNLLFRGKSEPDSVDGSIRELYNALRAGESAKTSAANPELWTGVMEPELKAGKDLLVIAFSSGLSTTYQSAVIAANDLAEQYPDRKIRVVDSRAASLGQGLLVRYACMKRDEGMELDALADWVTENRDHLCHWFTVDDLMYLKRGGRISAATAVMGTMLQIKPVMHMDEEGHLINVSKARGRKAAIQAIADKLRELGADYDNSTCFICHGDCLEDAQYLEKLIRERCGVQDVFIGYTGAVIGSHSGPGTLALFFLGKQK